MTVAVGVLAATVIAAAEAQDPDAPRAATPAQATSKTRVPAGELALRETETLTLGAEHAAEHAAMRAAARRQSGDAPDRGDDPGTAGSATTAPSGERPTAVDIECAIPAPGLAADWGRRVPLECGAVVVRLP